MRIPGIKSFLTNVKALQFFHLLRQGAVILIAILLTKSQLSVEAIGTYELLFFVGYAVSFFWVSGLIQGLLTTFPRLEPPEQRALVFNAFLVFSGISLGIFILLYLLREPALLVLTGQPELDYFNWFLLYLVLNLPAHLLENFYLLYRRPDRIIWFGLFSFALQLAAVLIPVFAGWGLQYSFVGLGIAGLLKYIWLMTFVLRHGRPALRPSMVRDWLLLSLPLMLYALTAGFNQTFDNWLVNFYYQGDEEKFAIFRYGARELPLVMALASAMGTALLPEVAADLRAGLTSIREKSRKLFHLLFPVSILMVLTSHWWFPLVFNEAFRDSILIFNIFLLIIVSRLIFSRTVLVGLNANRVILGISLLELGANVAFSFALVPLWGLAGIAAGTVLAHFLEKVLICLYLYWRFRVPVSDYTDLRWYFAYSAVLLVCFYISL